jgi:hypothetical protein
MILTCTRSALAALLVLALAAPAVAQSRASERDRRPACSRTNSCAPTLSAADRENLSRAMSRNVLHSIDDRLRRQRYN